MIRTRGHSVGAAISLGCLAIGAAAACLLGGVTLARIVLAVAVLLTAALVLGRWPQNDADRPPAYATSRVPAPSGYPSYDEIARRLSWAATSPSFTERVLQPWLRELAADLDVTDLPDRPQPDDVATRLESEVTNAAL